MTNRLLSAVALVLLSIWSCARASDDRATIARAATNEHLDRYDELLREYVDGDRVRYDAWRRSAGDRRALEEIVDELQAVVPENLDPADRYAHYVNLYNAVVLRLVVENGPLATIRELSEDGEGLEIFERSLVRMGAAVLSLNELEERLRVESGDPRIHFAVNCASVSCPPLAAEAYRGSRLDEQLDRQTRAFLRGFGALSAAKRPDGTLRLAWSPVFDWYLEDFGDVDGAKRFIVEHAPAAVGDHFATENVPIATLDYDWSLNDAAEPQEGSHASAGR